MEPFRYHVYVCDQQKPDGAPCCAARGSHRVVDSLRREIGARGLAGEVQITVCGSLGLCERGPNMVVYPEGVWYSGLQPEDVAEIAESHFRNGVPVARLVNADPGALHAEISGNRDRALAAMRAKDAAGVLPDDLNQTIRGFMESRVILTAIELDLFTAVGDGATAAEAAAKTGADARATGMLLNALVSLGLLAKSGNRFCNTPVSARFLATGAPESAQGGLLHTVRLWERWSHLTESVRTGAAARGDEVEDQHVAAFIAAMHNNARLRAGNVVRAVGTAGVARMLDVGGGSGAYSIAFAQAAQGLQAEIFDREAVLPIARRNVEEAGLSGRVTARPGDLRTGEFGSGYDLLLLSAICHMLSPDENRGLLQRAFRALAPGGRVVIQDFLLLPDKTGPKAATMFSLNMLVNTEAGASYSEPEYEDWLRQAGFTDVRRVPVPGPAGLMTGTRGKA